MKSPEELAFARQIADQMIPEDADRYTDAEARMVDWYLARDAVLTALEARALGAPLEVGATGRGFRKGEFVDRYGEACSIQDSSLATESAIWLGAGSERMHLTQDMVRALLPLLLRFVAFGSIGEPA